MQQLSLFGCPNVHDLAFAATRRRLLKGARTESANGQQWDLWKQQADNEKELALFFLDIRNFTSVTERYRAADVVYIVKKLFSRFQNIIRANHGRIIETSGDGFYAAFGLTCDIRAAVNAAVKAGMAILETLEKLNEHSLERNLGERIHVGIGLHSGKVAFGKLSLDTREHLVVMGYPVNVAARLQAATKELNNNFIISSTVFQVLTTPPLDVTTVKTTLKGIKEPYDLHLIGKAYAQE